MINNRNARRSAARDIASAADAAHETPCSRILLLILALVALTIQTLAVQSHVHHSAAAGRVQSASLIALLADQGADHSSGAQLPGYPDNEDPAQCPFCRQLAHSGQLAVGTAILVSFRYFTILGFIAFSEGAPAPIAVRHSWQSRAPPRE